MPVCASSSTSTTSGLRSMTAETSRSSNGTPRCATTRAGTISSRCACSPESRRGRGAPPNPRPHPRRFQLVHDRPGASETSSRHPGPFRDRSRGAYPATVHGGRRRHHAVVHAQSLHQLGTAQTCGGCDEPDAGSRVISGRVVPRVQGRLVISPMISGTMMRAAASISARWENACGKLPRCRPVSASNSSA